MYLLTQMMSYSKRGSLLQTAQTWANARVCSASCAHALGSMFVCYSLFVCLFVCFTGNLGDWVS